MHDPRNSSLRSTNDGKKARWVLLGLICVLLIAKTTSLSDNELSALESLKRAYPELLTFPGWNTPPSNGCKYYGVGCDGQHVTSLSIELKSNSVTPLPMQVGNFAFLRTLWLEGVSGPLPESIFDLPYLIRLHVQYGRTQYPFPASMCRLSNLTALSFINGSVYGELPSCMTEMTSLHSIFIVGTQIGGLLPNGLLDLPQLEEVDLSRNRFTGCVALPSTSNHLVSFSAANNNLRCVESSGPAWKILRMDLSKNSLSVFPPLQDLPSIQTLILSDNYIADTFPRSTSQLLNLKTLDVTNNSIPGLLPDIAQLENLAHLKVSSNRLTGFVSRAITISLETLDMSNNLLTGSMPHVNHQKLVYCDFHNNQLTSPSALSIGSTVLKHLDLSNNLLTHHWYQTVSFPGYLNLSHNKLVGSINIEPEWRVLDLSHNLLSGSINWGFLSPAFHSTLKLMSIVNNPLLTPGPIPRQWLRELDFSAPNITYSCKMLSFSGLAESFYYDDALFEYEMCTCNAGSFGVVSVGCQSCAHAMPGSIECLGSRTFSIASNFFPYFDEQGRLNTELCMANPDSTTSNPCRALPSLSITDVLLGKSCNNGSSERRCSRCICEGAQCWFRRGESCVKCYTMRLNRVAIVISLSILLCLVAIVTSIILNIVITRRIRRGDEGQLHGLPIGLFGILHFAASHGIPKTLLNFIQFAAALIDWNSAFDAYFLKLSNLDASGFGIQCVFREFTEPLAQLLLKVCVPLGLLVLVWLCIAFAWVLFQISLLVSKRKLKDIISDEKEEEGYLLGINGGNEAKIDEQKTISATKQHLRLGVSLSVSLLNFVYFGVSMALVSSFFSDHQSHTSNYYMRNFPYIGWNDKRAQQVRVVAGVFFFIVPTVPIAMFVLLVLLRSKLQDSRVKSLVGSLYEGYRPSLFWWELINLARKFSVAFVSSLSFKLALRNWLLVTVFASVLALQLLWQPWRRRLENVGDQVASIILIVCIVANMKNAVGVTGGPTLLIIARILIVVFIVGAAIVWIWSVITEIKAFRNKAKETNEHTKDLLLLESSSEQSSLFEETEDESSRVEKSERQTLLVGQ